MRRSRNEIIKSNNPVNEVMRDGQADKFTELRGKNSPTYKLINSSARQLRNDHRKIVFEMISFRFFQNVPKEIRIGIGEGEFSDVIIFR